MIFKLFGVKKEASKIIALLCFFVVGCSSNKDLNKAVDYNKGIVYILPYNISNQILERINTNSDKNIYFILDVNTKYDDYRIYLFNFINTTKWIMNTNRYIAINEKLYPVIFMSDYTFANTESAEEYLKNYKPGVTQRNQKYPNLEFADSIHFRSDGTLISN